MDETLLRSVATFAVAEIALIALAQETLIPVVEQTLGIDIAIGGCITSIYISPEQ